MLHFSILSHTNSHVFCLNIAAKYCLKSVSLSSSIAKTAPSKGSKSNTLLIISTCAFFKLTDFYQRFSAALDNDWIYLTEGHRSYLFSCSFSNYRLFCVTVSSFYCINTIATMSCVFICSCDREQIYNTLARRAKKRSVCVFEYTKRLNHKKTLHKSSPRASVVCLSFVNATTGKSNTRALKYEREESVSSLYSVMFLFLNNKRRVIQREY